MFTRIRLLLPIRPLISSFFLSLQFSTFKFFVTLFSGTMRPRRLKLGIHMDSGQMYHVYQNQAVALIHPFISSFFFLSNFQHWNFWSQFSRELWGLADWNLVHTWTVGRCIMYTRIRPAAYLSLYFFIFLSLRFSTLKFFVTLFSGTMRPRRLKIGTLVNSGQMYHVYQIQAAAAYLSLYSSFFFLSDFQTLKFLSHFSWELWGLEDWNLVQMWIVGWCIVYTGIRLLFLFLPLFHHFSFSPIIKH